jgi:hypothetical protein
MTCPSDPLHDGLMHEYLPSASLLDDEQRLSGLRPSPVFVLALRRRVPPPTRTFNGLLLSRITRALLAPLVVTLHAGPLGPEYVFAAVTVAMHTHAYGLMYAFDSGGRARASPERYPVRFENEVVLCEDRPRALLEERLPMCSP